MFDEQMERRIGEMARTRMIAKKEEIEHSLRQIAAGNPLGAETKASRRINRIANKARLPARDAEAISHMIGRAAEQIERGGAEAAIGGPEAIQGPTIDFVGVEFLARARLAANTVGRVVFRDGLRAQGTGFLVGPGLFLTNNHVIETPAQARQMQVEFDYESDGMGKEVPATMFSFDADQCFAFDPIRRLDFTLIAIGERIRGPKRIEAFGYIPLSDASDKHMLGEIANIVQHPLGKLKQIVVRENNLVSRDETQQVLHYLADTEKGSSGSPVCNNEWEPIALHHWGGPALELTDPQGRPLRRDINEGVRISAIVRALRSKALRLPSPAKERVGKLVALWTAAKRGGPVGPESAGAYGDGAGTASGAVQQRVRRDGSISWIFPVEISVRAPLLEGPAAAVEAPPPAALPGPALMVLGAERAPRGNVDFSDRGGYEPGFIPGFVVPFPRLQRVPYRLAENRKATGDDDKHELRYHHFSIAMNADRRLAAVTACNIDGARSVAVNRSDKTVNLEPTLKDLGVEALGPEGGDDFAPDSRILPEEQMAREFYEEQEVPGFPKPDYPGRDAPAAARSAYAKAMSERTARMFQKGHIILRGDPAWGMEEEALAAEADTFFYTNAAPQLGFFNQGSADNRPGSKGKLRWRAVESYILRNAFTMRQRVCVFAGPVFDDKYDVEYRQGVLVPMRFWKIAVWAEADGLRSIALIADQKPVLETLTQGTPEAAERYTDENEMARMAEFLTTVADIEDRTGFDFGKAIRDADVRGDVESPSPAIEADPSVLTRTRRRRGARSSARKKGAKRSPRR